jgi:hypothetical protein
MTQAHSLQREALMDRYGLKLAARLDDQALPQDISERLRFAREQALARHKRALAAQTQTSSSVFSSGSGAVLGGLGWFGRIAGALPLVALAIGLVAANVVVDEERANELAEVDLQLLTDDLPPAAYTDPGFAQFLKFGTPGSQP